MGVTKRKPKKKVQKPQKKVKNGTGLDLYPRWYRFSRKNKCHTVDTVRHKGVRTFMKQFLPTPLLPLPYRDPPLKNCGMGAKFGTKIHNQLSHFARYHEFRSNPPHRVTHMILKELDKRGLMPVGGNVPVTCRRTRYTTTIDVLCMDKKDRFVVVEIKTGTQFDLTLSRQNFGGVLKSVPYSFLNDAALQLMATSLLFHHTHPTSKIGHPLVIHAAKREITVYSIPKELERETDNICKLLLGEELKIS